MYAFEATKDAVQIPRPISAPKPSAAEDFDTIIVPAQEEGFKRVFIGQDCWYEIRIASEKLDKIKYIAAYQTQPIAAITHFAPVHHIEPYGDAGKYKLVFAEPAQALSNPVPFGDATQGAMQSCRYTTLKKLQAAKKLTDIIGKAAAAG